MSNVEQPSNCDHRTRFHEEPTTVRVTGIATPRGGRKKRTISSVRPLFV